jgi:translocation and assembly module TamA
VAPPRIRRPARPAWTLVLLLAAALTVAADARGAGANPGAEADADTDTTADAAAPSAPDALRYKVVIAAPAPLAEVLGRAVGLARWQGYADMSDDLLDRLASEAIDEAREAVAAEGYFSAVVDVAVDRSVDPIAVTLTVTPGEPTRIAAVRIEVTGPATTDRPRGTRAIAAVRAGWTLREGDVFRQSAWAAAKDGARATLAASPFAAATIERSEALIDPVARTADLTVELASGPAFRFGTLDILGLKRYDASLVRNFATIRAGDPYSQPELEQFVRRLNASGYFASVQASIDPDVAHADDATINVAVIEAPSRRFEGGFGYSTDVLFRANASYRDVNFDGQGLQLHADARLETKEQIVSLRLTRPPNDAGWIGTIGAGAHRTDIEGLVTRTAFAGTRWNTVEERRERALAATFFVDEQLPSGAEAQRAHALYVEAEQYWRETDVVIAPNRGWMASLQAGGGIPGASTRGFGRVIGRFAAWYPVDRATTLHARAEAGAVLAPTRDGIPSTLLFRTGGDTTVRGYAFESLGVKSGDAVVGGRYLAVGSVEAIRWIGESWGLAAFVDAGNAGDSLPDFRFDVGYGVGARVRTPIGPFRLDLAYGQQSHDVRVHFSVGLSF